MTTLFFTFCIFLTSLVLCTILVPYMLRLSALIGGVDIPDGRKVHTHAVPRLGGIAIFSSLLFTTLFFCDLNQQTKWFLSGATLIFLTGLADDLKSLTPRQKFAGQFLAAGMPVVMGGIVVRHLGNPFGLGTIELGLLAIPFTVIGIVGLTNAINFMDGLDSLAGGVCTIATVSFAIISYNSGNQTLFPLSIAILGALIGFLRFNKYPAKIFMGDGGSLLLGYCMGTFSVMLAGWDTVAVSPYVPLMILGVPILDTLVVMVNRTFSGKPMFLPDKTHLHHRLLELGIGHRPTMLIVVGIAFLLNSIAVLGSNINGTGAFIMRDPALLLLLTTVAATMYGAIYFLTSQGWKPPLDVTRYRSFRSTAVHRRFIQLTGSPMMVIKAIVISIMLFLSLFNIGMLMSGQTPLSGKSATDANVETRQYVVYKEILERFQQ